ncbi:MAG: hypothetical protein IPO35_17630 [Uliginosibacterium sp.]|nr:hypothetical protein [Uliginosibacterium sp.]
MSDGSQEAIEEMLIYLPVCKDLGLPEKQAFVDSDDLFIREGFAHWLQYSVVAGDLVYAEKLVADKFPQVANPLKRQHIG